jgi:murein DD-endopeptidase MepM/ murein hydrolase activator NlpD
MAPSTSPRRAGAGRILWLAWPAAGLVFLGAAAPAISQRVPRFFFPALAALGAALLVVSVARSLARLGRGRWRSARALVSLAINAVAVLVLAVLPLTHVLRVLTAPAGGPPRILAGFGDWLGSEGYPILGRHRGVDIAGTIGADVLAAAEGRVVVARDSGDLCGLIVAIVHDPHGYRTVYCHLSRLAVAPGERVTRGQRIGALGTTGQRAWPGYEHVHLELQRGEDSNNLEDPVPRIVGCFDAGTAYPRDRLALTYPVRC